MPDGRWPANVILSPEMAEVLDAQTGVLKSGALKPYSRADDSDPMFKVGQDLTYASDANEGGASRFFLNAGYEPWELEWIYSVGLRPCGSEEQ